MSSEPLTVVRSFFAADDDAGTAAHLAPDVVWFGTRGGLDEGRVMRGPQAALDYLREIRGVWERFDIEVEQELESGDAVMVFMRERGRTRHGGIELQSETAMIFKVRDGKIAEMQGYLDRDEALKAAGLKA